MHAGVVHVAGARVQRVLSVADRVVFGDLIAVAALIACIRRRHKIEISKKTRLIFPARLGECLVHSLRVARSSGALPFDLWRVVFVSFVHTVSPS